jgi:predicted membrane chloride channel (bestrophin family)
MAGAAKRDAEGRLTDASKEAIDDVAQLQRLIHILFWAKEKRSYGILLSPRGLSRMLSRGLMTNEQYASLLEVGLRNSGAWQACLTWMTTAFTVAATEGHIKESTYLLVLLENTTNLRGLMVDVDDMYAGRCPIVYIHFVQLLVDCYIIIAPFAIVVDNGYWAILSVAILTLFYVGLLEVAKMLLDPLDNDIRSKRY